MKNAFDWLVRHEKLVIVATAVLVVALAANIFQSRFASKVATQRNPAPSALSSDF